MNTLKAEKRSMSVKAKALRREGYVVGNVFGHNIEGSIPIRMEKKDAEALLKEERKGGRVELLIDDARYDCLIKEIDYNAMKKEYSEIDFQVLVQGEKVHSVAEIVIRNHDAIKNGILEELLHEISYRALPSALVEKVIVDVGNMRVGDRIKVKDLPIASDKDVVLHTDPETVIVEVVAAKNAVAAEEAETEEETKKETKKQ